MNVHDVEAALIWAGMVLLALFLMSTLSEAQAQQHTHEGVVGEFYMKWNKPDKRDDKGGRYQSCCSAQDCTVRPIRQVNAHWEYLSLYHKKWMPIPQEKLEQTYPDAEESPDGQSHVCEDPYTGALYCVTLGSGT